MRHAEACALLVLGVVLLPWAAGAQEKTTKEIEIHKNVKLITTSAPADMPKELRAYYEQFLPLFETVLRENTNDRPDQCALTVQVEGGIKEIGAAKVARPLARVRAFKRNSRSEYLGTLILYSYISTGPVNKEEVSSFLTRTILDLVKCDIDAGE